MLAITVIVVTELKDFSRSYAVTHVITCHSRTGGKISETVQDTDIASIAKLRRLGCGQNFRRVAIVIGKRTQLRATPPF